MGRHTIILYNEGATQAQADEAEDIVGVLTLAYPGHPWAVRVYDGGFFIRHLAFPEQWGMNCKTSTVSHDAAIMRRQIIRMAGEWLERANMKRGAFDAEQEVIKVEGVPEKKTQDVELVIPAEVKPLRTEPRRDGLS